MARFDPSPETFVVEEIPAYLPAGLGEHTYLWIEKRSMTTWDAIATLARRLRVDERAVGSAGLKDKHATTRQWLSVPRVAPEVALAAGDERLRVLQAIPHGNKLRTGHLRGNRFEVMVTGLEPDEGERLLDRLAALMREGLPNRYGDQRFGRDGDNVARGLELLRGRGRERDARRRRLLLSAVQSAVFNEVLRSREVTGSLGRVLPGDVLQKVASGGVFTTEDPRLDQARVDAGEIVITGPMPGGWAREPPPGSEARALEDRAIAAVGATREDFAAAGRDLPGARRPLVIEVKAHTPAGESPSSEASTLRIGFELPAGTYATVLVETLGVTVGQPGAPLPESMLTR